MIWSSTQDDLWWEVSSVINRSSQSVQMEDLLDDACRAEREGYNVERKICLHFDGCAEWMCWYAVVWHRLELVVDLPPNHLVTNLLHLRILDLDRSVSHVDLFQSIFNWAERIAERDIPRRINLKIVKWKWRFDGRSKKMCRDGRELSWPRSQFAAMRGVGRWIESRPLAWSLPCPSILISSSHWARYLSKSCRSTIRISRSLTRWSMKRRANDDSTCFQENHIEEEIGATTAIDDLWVAEGSLWIGREDVRWRSNTSEE